MGWWYWRPRIFISSNFILPMPSHPKTQKNNTKMDGLGIITFQEILLTSWDIQLSLMNQVPPNKIRIFTSLIHLLTTFDHVAHGLHQFGFAEAERNHTGPTCDMMRTLGNPLSPLVELFPASFPIECRCERSYVHKSAAICDSWARIAIWA